MASINVNVGEVWVRTKTDTPNQQYVMIQSIKENSLAYQAYATELWPKSCTGRTKLPRCRSSQVGSFIGAYKKVSPQELIEVDRKNREAAMSRLKISAGDETLDAAVSQDTSDEAVLSTDKKTPADTVMAITDREHLALDQDTSDEAILSTDKKTPADDVMTITDREHLAEYIFVSKKELEKLEKKVEQLTKVVEEFQKSQAIIYADAHANLANLGDKIVETITKLVS